MSNSPIDSTPQQRPQQRPEQEPSDVDPNAVLDNRRDAVRRLGPGYRVTVPILAAASGATAVATVAPVGRSVASAPLVLVMVAALGVVAAVVSVCDLTTGLGRWVKYAVLAGCVATAVLFPLNRASSTLVDLTLFMVFGIAILGLNLIQGYAGKASLAQVSFLGIGAYLAQFFDQGRKVRWGQEPNQWGFTFPNVGFLTSILIAGLFCFGVGILIGFPALRVQGPWLAFITVAFNGIMLLIFTNEDELTGGTQGIRALRRATDEAGDDVDLRVFGISLFDPWRYYMFCLAWMTIVALAIWWIVRSPWGRSFRAIRDNAGRASSLGVNVRTYTLLAFALGSGMAGIAGALYGPAVESIDPTAFPASKSFLFLLAAVVGGAGTLVGPFLGAGFITIVENRLRYLTDNESWRKLGESYQIIFALFVIIIMIVAPKGIVGSVHLLKERISAKQRERSQ
jgi:branched-chain amino acid transport system permease protein